MSGLIAAAMTALGCPDDPSGGPDAGVDAAPDATAAGFAPDRPSPPALTPCPAGWLEVAATEDDPVATCEPWPETGPGDCADGEARFVGQEGCAPIGGACPSGEWAEDLPTTGRVLYVRAGAPAGVGDGTRDAPFGTIAEAMAGASPSTVVALGKGIYDEAVELRRGVTLWGACVAETTLTCSVPAIDEGTVTAPLADGVVRGVRITGQRPGFRIVGGSASIRLEGVLISEPVGFGLAVAFGGRATLVDVVVRDTVELPGIGGGRGLGIEMGGQVEITRAIFERSAQANVAVSGETSTLIASDLAILGNRCGADADICGRGIEVSEGARVEVDRGIVDEAHELAVSASLEGSFLRLSQVVVRRTASRASRDPSTGGYFGRGLSLSQGATAEVRRCLFDGNADIGVSLQGAGSALVMEDSVIRGTVSQPDGLFGRGANVQDGARLEARRTALLRNHDIGVGASMEGTVITLTDVIVSGTRSRPVDGLWGRGLHAQAGAEVTALRGLFDGNREVGVSAASVGTTVSLTDVTIQQTERAECPISECTAGGLGFGLVVLIGAHVDGHRFLLTDNAVGGIQLAYGCSDPDLCEPSEHGGTADLHEGEISHHSIGANVQTLDFDLDRLMDRVLYIDNDRDLDTEALPVPSAGLPSP